MSSIFSTSKASWGQLTTLNAGSDQAKQVLSGTSPGNMTIETFVQASRETQVAWLKANGNTATIKGDLVLTLQKETETYQKATYQKDGNGKQLYDPYGQPVVKYEAATRDVESVAVQQKDGLDGLQASAGEKAATIPYQNLPGSGSAASATLNRDTAERLFPTIDGINVKLPVSDRPDGFDVTPAMLTSKDLIAGFMKAFNTWHPAYQVEWMEKNKGSAPGGVLTLKDGGTTLATLVASVPPTATPALGEYSVRPRVYQVESLSKNDFATMPAKDQARVAGTDSFKAISKSIGLSTDRQPFLDAMSGLENAITSYTAGNRGNSKLPDDAQKAFLDQLTYLRTKLNGMSVFSENDINDQIKELKQRFDRLAAFYNVAEGKFEPGQTGNYGTRVNVGDDDASVVIPKSIVSMDDNATINAGYDTFLKQEMRIRDMVATRASVAAGDGVLNGKKLDAPSLVYYFQNQYNLEGEARVVADTEEVKQQNAYLQTISEIQRLVNQTLTKFGKSDDSHKNLNDFDVNYIRQAAEKSLQSGSDPAGAAEAIKTLKIIAMFNNASPRQPHPLEALRGFTRQTYDITKGNVEKKDIFGDPIAGSAAVDSWDMRGYQSTTWPQYGTQLSEMVTIVNQNSQLQMNNINSMDRQRNRHYDLANSALQKLSDMVQSIAQAG